MKNFAKVLITLIGSVTIVGGVLAAINMVVEKKEANVNREDTVDETEELL